MAGRGGKYEGPYQAGQNFYPNRDVERQPPPVVIVNKRRERSRLSCLCWTALLALAGFIIGLAVAIVCLWLFYKPEAPKFELEELNVGAFSVAAGAASTSGGATPYLLSANVSFVLLVHNRARFTLYYKETNVSMAYDGQTVGYALVPAFHQRKRSERNVTGTLVASNVSLVGTPLYTDYLAGSLPLQFAGKVRAHVKIYSVSSPSVSVWLRCNATVNPQTRALLSKNCNFHL